MARRPGICSRCYAATRRQSRAARVPLADSRAARRIAAALPSQLARQRPDIRASEALLHKASAERRRGDGQPLSEPQLSGSREPSHQLATSSATAINIWSIGANLLQPLFRGGELQARKRAAVAAYDQAAAAYRDSGAAWALQNVADVLRAIEADTQAWRRGARRPRRPTMSYRSRSRRFDAGAVSQLAVLDAERKRLPPNWTECRPTPIRYADAVALLQAMGGGWWSQPKAAPPGQ